MDCGNRSRTDDKAALVSKLWCQVEQYHGTFVQPRLFVCGCGAAFASLADDQTIKCQVCGVVNTALDPAVSCNALKHFSALFCCKDCGRHWVTAAGGEEKIVLGSSMFCTECASESPCLFVMPDTVKSAWTKVGSSCMDAHSELQHTVVRMGIKKHLEEKYGSRNTKSFYKAMAVAKHNGNHLNDDELQSCYEFVREHDPSARGKKNRSVRIFHARVDELCLSMEKEAHSCGFCHTKQPLHQLFRAICTRHNAHTVLACDGCRKKNAQVGLFATGCRQCRPK